MSKWPNNWEWWFPDTMLVCHIFSLQQIFFLFGKSLRNLFSTIFSCLAYLFVQANLVWKGYTFVRQLEGNTNITEVMNSVLCCIEQVSQVYQRIYISTDIELVCILYRICDLWEEKKIITFLSIFVNVYWKPQC